MAAKETMLAVVLTGILTVPDAWEGFAQAYRTALGGRPQTRGDLAEFNRPLEEKLRRDWTTA